MPASSIKLPGFGLPLSAGLKQTFEENGRFPHAISDSFCIDGLTLREARMLDFINQITDKPRWTEKINDEAIVEKWRNEACGTDDSWVWDSRKLSPNCFDYCLAELRDKADYAQKHGLIHVLECSATIVKKDLAEDDHFCQDLGQAVEVLEDVPEHRKDWHPYTNGLVLDLLHPSLHPLKYGMSRVLPVGEVDLATCMTSTGCGAIIPVPPEVEGDVELERKLAYGDDTSLKPWGSYQWLPTDITFDDNGKAKIESYINNLHPQRHTELYPVLREAVDRALPLWEECLSYFNDRLRIKVEGCGYADYILPAQFEMSTWDAQQRRNADAMRNEGDADEVMQDEGQAEVNQDEFEGFERLDTGDETPEAPAVELNTEEADEADDGDEEVEVDDKGDGDDEGENESTGPSPSDLEYERDDAINDWLNENPELRQIKQPEPNDPYTPFAERAAAEELQKLDFRTKFPQGLQVIFKLANIELTPDNPKYEGSSWHVEGALNEHICATALLYYSSDNISDSRLDFRSHVDSEAMVSRPEQNEYLACEDLYGITQEGIAVQDIGSVLTREGRWLAFPNVMQHRVAPFGLADKSHPGHRKILAMFLVDPHIRVLSTANVPPQRVDWWADEVRKIGRFARLPQEVFERIIEGVEGFPFSWAEALEMREALMEERGRQKDSYDEATGQDTFYFCEH